MCSFMAGLWTDPDGVFKGTSLGPLTMQDRDGEAGWGSHEGKWSSTLICLQQFLNFHTGAAMQ